MTRVKICGCMRPEDALAARDAGADFIGLVFAPESRRRLTLGQAKAIVAALRVRPSQTEALSSNGFADITDRLERGARSLEDALARGRPRVVGVFADQRIDEVNEIADAVGLDLVQLSGREPWEVCARAKRPVIKAVEAHGAAEDVLRGLEIGAAIAIMLDASRGRGIAVDWEVAAAVARRMPVWLAGGLTPENVGDAVRAVRPWAVDVSSGVETGGAKDPDKIGAFVEAAKAAGSSISERRA